MEIASIQKALSSFLDALTSQTYLGTYKETTRSSLLKEGLSTRANSIWKMAEYVIATYDNDESTPLQDYLDGWNKLAKNYGNQYLIIAIDKSNWQMYDSQGLLLGDNEYILGLSKKKRSSTDSGSTKTIQTIYYGCPGTGKSHQVKDLTEGLLEEKTIKFDDGTINVFRTTFHPDYDYATFVGCYKPVKEDGVLDYKFVPQVFTNAYVTAKKHPEAPIYLIIEEINRGNCAQIFGDLFQLLDRENGESKFPIDAEEELMKYLRDEAQLDEYIKIKLPANFNIYATMNTSDQSLFPMDSAFKRRWEMKYIKIDYTNQEADYTFKVNGADYHWLEYLPCINDKITLATDSEDKQMGEFFIRSNMSATEFKNKVMFYLWNDVCKDLYSGKNSPQSFFFRDIYGNPFKFTELFNEPAPGASEEDKKDPRKNGDLLLEGFLYYVKNGKKKAPKTEAITEQTVEEPEEGGEQPAE